MEDLDVTKPQFGEDGRLLESILCPECLGDAALYSYQQEFLSCDTCKGSGDFHWSEPLQRYLTRAERRAEQRRGRL